jgi:hypothetical protein
MWRASNEQLLQHFVARQMKVAAVTALVLSTQSLAGDADEP